MRERFIKHSKEKAPTVSRLKNLTKSGNKKIVISLGDDGAIISSFADGSLQKRVFVTSTASTDFIEFLTGNEDAQIYLLLDIIDQNYIFSNLPLVGKKNIKKIIRRKIKSEFDPADINSYLFLGKDLTSTKKSLKYLFVSVRNSNPFKDWLDAILKLPNKFMGIYLIPIESERFIEKIRGVVHGQKRQAPDAWEIFISYNRVGGFRQVVLRNGRLIFTRISQSASLQTADSVGKNISQEGANTLEYIRRIGYFEQSISVYVICAKEAATFIDIAGIRPKDLFVFNPHEIATKLGLKNAAQENDKYGDIIFSASFIENEKILRLSNPEIDKATKLSLISKSIKALGVALTALLPLLIVYFLYSSIQVMSRTSKLEREITAKNLELGKVRDFKKEYNIEPRNIIDIVRFKNTVSSKDAGLFDLLKLYQETDKFSSGVEDIKLNIDDNSQKLELQAVFEFNNRDNLSDIFLLIEKYTKALTEAFKGRDVVFSGLPKENEIKLDLDEGSSAANVEKSYKISVTISSSNRPIRGPR